MIDSTQIRAIKNVPFRKWVESKNGLIRPKELKLVEKIAESSLICAPKTQLPQQNKVYAEVLENIFYGDYYEIIVRVENLRLSLHSPDALKLGKITLWY